MIGMEMGDDQIGDAQRIETRLVQADHRIGTTINQYGILLAQEYHVRAVMVSAWDSIRDAKEY
jgi:hypothetical protein